jgi:glyceraldehyde-3-phosphate dehydrogenase/erythrose-4-phosphate dehydrogenase
MTIKIGINGFGRMGRLGMRAARDFAVDTPDMRFEWGHVNRMMDIVRMVARST